nr:MAG TPA: hypothetical protein [Caudoviricetes sp.]
MMSLLGDVTVHRENANDSRVKFGAGEHDSTQVVVVFLDQTKLVEFFSSLLFFGKVDESTNELVDTGNNKHCESECTDHSNSLESTEVLGGDVVNVKKTRVGEHCYSFHRRFVVLIILPADFARKNL